MKHALKLAVFAVSPIGSLDGRRRVDMYYQWANCRYAGEMKSGYEGRELPEATADRPRVPDDVFCYPDVASWRDRIWALLSDILTDAVKGEFKRNPPEYIVSDDLTWLNEIVFTVEGHELEMKSLGSGPIDWLRAM